MDERQLDAVIPRPRACREHLGVSLTTAWRRERSDPAWPRVVCMGGIVLDIERATSRGMSPNSPNDRGPAREGCARLRIAGRRPTVNGRDTPFSTHAVTKTVHVVVTVREIADTIEAMAK